MPDTDSGRWWAGKRWYGLSAASGISCCNTINSGQCLGRVHPKQLTVRVLSALVCTRTARSKLGERGNETSNISQFHAVLA